MSEELKPCPFCGEKAIARKSFFTVGRVECPHCEITVSARSEELTDAIAMWNRRPTSETERAREAVIEAAKAYREEYPFPTVARLIEINDAVDRLSAAEGRGEGAVPPKEER